MSNALQKSQPQQHLTLVCPSNIVPLGINETKWQILTQQLYPTVKSAESIALAVMICVENNFDPMKKPVHIVPVWDAKQGRYVDQVWFGINALEVIAHRTKLFAGKDKPVFGAMVEKKFGSQTIMVPESCEVTVHRFVQGQKCAFTEEVFFDERCVKTKEKTLNKMWTQMPKSQLAKCALAAALRLAFPEELGGQYAAEEMEGRTINEENSFKKEVSNRVKAAQNDRDVDGEIVDPRDAMRQDQIVRAQAQLDVASERGLDDAASEAKKKLDALKGITSNQCMQLTSLAQQNGWNDLKVVVDHIVDVCEVPTENRSAWRKYVTEQKFNELLEFFGKKQTEQDMQSEPGDEYDTDVVEGEEVE